MNIELKRTIDRDVLENVFVTAIEGGSNYWYFLRDDTIEVIRSYVPKEVDPCISTAILKALEKGLVIEIHDAEDEDSLVGELNMDTFATRLQKLYDDTNYSSALALEIEGNGDAYSSDVVFQYLAMGEVVYG